MKAHVSSVEDFRVDLEAHVSSSEDYGVDLEAHVSPVEDFRVDPEAHVSPKTTLESRLGHQLMRVANKILSAPAHVSILQRFEVRA